ncbi:hydantoinase B/oxoprolinase family protein [Rhizorhabdus sp.]|jgi:N-methylhydantoinase B|uniref:hydantoinase B/oxoprolinase family protein n=1 Tax=Rhizorhabdus sp. TaxID=1968843 RepID=UPI0035AE3565
MTFHIDPVTLEVIRNALTAAAEEISLVVMRSARSPLLREAGDHSSVITDADGYLIAQGRDVPMHMGVMSFTVREFLRLVPKAQLAPGDVWFLNIPAIGGNHLPDVKAIRPVFVDGELAAFAVSLAHWADVGGAVPGSYVANATDAWQEGLRIPPLRVFTADGADTEKLGVILANVRGAAERKGDILAQVAATRAAELRVQQIASQHGAGLLRAAMAAIHDRAEAQMRAVISSIPDGDYEGADWLDDDAGGGGPVAIRVRVRIAGDTATFDFGGCDPAARGPVNTTPFIAAASVFYVMKALFGPEIQPSGGCYRPFKIITKPGTVLDPGPDKPVVGGNHETSQRIADAVFRAFEAIVPERLTAGGPTTSGLILFGGRRADGIWTTLYETHGGGEGARADRDGAPVIRVHMSNVMNTPAEVIEAEYPLRIEAQSLRRGSGGEGRHRGGDGLHRVYRVLCEDMSVTSMFERRVVPPYGLDGGEPGAAFKVEVLKSDGTGYELPGKANIRLGPGDHVIVNSCGGGGYGAPAQSQRNRKNADQRREPA